MTYSFEKESNISDITLWFKKSGISDEDWLEIPEQKRMEIIKKATNVKKDAVANSRITGTEFKPSYVGGYSQELNHSMFDKGYTWEIANKKYEIDLDRTLDQVKEVSEFSGETHSFHTHVVFDMPTNYKKFDKFQLWSKQANDYLYLKGMEEGLHGNYLTGVAHLPGQAPAKAKMTVGNTLPSSLSSVSMQSHKFFSLGVRADIYGKSPIAGHKKLGLELRDSTRNLDTLNSHMKKISSTVGDYAWEKIPKKMSSKDMSLLVLNKKLIKDELGGHVSPGFLKRLQKKVITSGIPLNSYENGKYFDFSTGKMKALSDEQKMRVVKSREYFIDELKKIDIEIQGMIKKGEKFEDADIRMAVEMSMSEWAKMAKVSEFYSGI